MKTKKSILLIAPVFYGYHILIRDQFISLGMNVTFIPERKYNTIYNVLKHIHPKLKKAYSNFFLKKEVQALHDEYDYVLIIRGECVGHSEMNLLHKRFKDAKFILYMWDSIKENSNTIKIFQYFDHIFSFDPYDVKHNDFIEYLPLFYNQKTLASNTEEILDIDILFIGQDHSDRYFIIKEVEKFCKQNNLIFVKKLVTSEISFYRKVLMIRSYKNAKKKDFTFKNISFQEVSQLSARSKCVLDINTPKQSGLTMRTFEVLASGKKLISTNENIYNEPFYSNENILVIDRQNVIISVDFFKEKIVEKNIVTDYSLENWSKKILNT